MSVQKIEGDATTREKEGTEIDEEETLIRMTLIDVKADASYVVRKAIKKETALTEEVGETVIEGHVEELLHPNMIEDVTEIIVKEDVVIAAIAVHVPDLTPEKDMVAV